MLVPLTPPPMTTTFADLLLILQFLGEDFTQILRAYGRHVNDAIVSRP